MSGVGYLIHCMEERSEVGFPLDTFAEKIDAIAAIERDLATLTAQRALAIDDARRFAQSIDLGDFHDRALRAEIACALRVPENTALTMVEHSRALVGELPATFAALQNGSISYRHAQKLIDEVGFLPRDAWAEFERAVLPDAEQLTVAKFTARARTIRERSHPESIATRTIAAVERRSMGVEPAHDGMAWLSAYLPAEQAQAIMNRITDIARGLRCGEEERTFTQLKVDTLTDLLINGEISASRGIAATVMVTVPVLTLIGTSEAPATLDGMGPISPEVARELAASAPTFIRILTHPETGVVLSVGREHYRPPSDLRRWLRVRDGTCRFPGCGQPARTTDIYHTTDWQYGGSTRADNLACVCGGHHGLKHHSTWKVRQKGHGVIEWTSPSGHRYITKPQVDLGR